MIKKIEQIHWDLKKFIANGQEDIETFKVKYLGKKGKITELFKEFKTLPSREKKYVGAELNRLKNECSEIIFQNKYKLSKNEESLEDLTKSGKPYIFGARHPISLVKNKIINIFNQIGFTSYESPEIEDDWHNFTALNIPYYHPARNMQDTFFIEKDPDILLRTHTSSVQIRYMEKHSPPIRILSSGRVYRNEAISPRSHQMFHQIEGLYVDTKVSFSDLKQMIQYFTNSLFGSSRIRLRPSYFPFTVPSAEVDVYCELKTKTGWLEIMGCGMVNTQVFRNVDIDPDKFSGFAFGMGIERIALFLYKIGDLRLFFENDIRFLRQFESIH
ncbi:phenylalanine--tRNA ligase subunit alpha [Candidatus Walczuchella monophlebidarum]|uniref:Phenylalanine--tRNA ligase alpha subunit n=1 Tax=Candidatus Walczuchella monophlebidarum TaxID=1415657 RepID=A0A068DST4_9FLAO|nr:phenylalanine--tRNA ligase subunit alpha [Candidatus Walczuchella monophlebidarum]AID37459.1 phenylalanyl-tRNA synthetase subunit alpha [Candidatus Walczuchella monophlebidarum]